LDERGGSNMSPDQWRSRINRSISPLKLDTDKVKITGNKKDSTGITPPYEGPEIENLGTNTHRIVEYDQCD